MSTKIHNGYRFNSADLKKIMPMLHRLGRHYEDMLRIKVAIATAEIAVEVMDDHTLGRLKDDVDTSSSPYLFAYHLLDKRGRAIKCSEKRDPAADFGFDVTIIPRAKDSLILLYTEHDEFRACMSVVPGMEPFPYWNNTDRPDGMTARQWTARGQAWSDAMGKEGVPGRVGLSRSYFTHLPHFEPTFLDEVVKRVPSIDTRATRIAHDMHRDAYVAKHAKKLPMDSNGFLDSIIKWCGLARTPEGKAKIAKLSARIQKKLLPKITRQTLLETLALPTKAS